MFPVVIFVPPALAFSGPDAVTTATSVCAPERLRTEYEPRPLGLDVPKPRLSWALCTASRAVIQYGYAVEITDLDQGRVVWQSGTVVSNRSTNVPSLVGAPALAAAGSFSWRVKWFADAKTASPWSAPATFTTGLYNDKDWSGAQWITMFNGTDKTRSPEHVLLRSKVFSLPEGKTVRRAEVYVVGLGYYKLYLDGMQVSTHQLGAFTTFEKRVLYDTWDATAALTAGGISHVVAVELGSGFYTQRTVNASRPKLCRLLLSIR